jgi:hypothetical protein
MDEPPAIGRIMPIVGRGCEGLLGFLGWVHFWELGATVVVLVVVVAFRVVC